MLYSYEAFKGNRIHSSTFRQPDPKTSDKISLVANSSIEEAGQRRPTLDLTRCDEPLKTAPHGQIFPACLMSLHQDRGRVHSRPRENHRGRLARSSDLG